ncbi:MAG: hypothetical protein JXR94_23275 [Candidatus Hydrogenedentes bacterium]|nr:hypothetical protein [Candidatus Hydrogenedentota bacterium]
MLICPISPLWLTLAAGLGVSRSPGDYAPVLLLACVGALFFFGYHKQRKRSRH